MKVKQIHLTSQLTDEYCDSLGGQFLSEDSYDTLLKEDADVFKPDGTPLLHFRKRVIPDKMVRDSWPVFKDAAVVTDNRGMAAGPVHADHLPNRPIAVQAGHRARMLKPDGTVSNTSRANQVMSGIIGYMDRSPRYPYCRLTAYNLAHEERFKVVVPMLRTIDKVFQKNAPERYAAQRAVVEKTHPDFYIHGTAFTTVTVNRNFQTAVHKDQGDLAEGMGVLSCLRGGKFEGCYFCFPKFRIACDMRSGDVLLADVHEWHGNTPIHGIKGMYERISLVLYYREGMRVCGSASEEQSQAKTKRGALT